MIFAKWMGGTQVILIDYINNLSIFALLVSIPLVIRSFINHKPIKRYTLWGGIYGGIVSIILVLLSIHKQGYSYDIRYAPVILVFAYMGPAAGFITGIFSLLIRLFSNGQWTPAIIGWSIIMISFTIIHFIIPKVTAIKKSVILYISYVVIYIVTVPILFNVFRDKPIFHLQYVVFVMLGIIVGVLLLEAYLKMYRLNNRLSDMYKMVGESESKYRLIAENTSDLIMVMDKKLSISYFSPSHETVLGYQLNEIESFELCKFIHSDDVPLFKQTMHSMFETKESQSMEFRLRHKDGYYIEFESRCMPVKGEEHTIEHIVIISRDISERKKSEEILLQSEKLSIVGELAAGVAHEIRNPLTTIKGFIQLYKRDNSSIDGLLLSELERIEGITSELLSLGKPQAIQLNQTNLRELLEGTLELLAPEALMKNIQCTFEAEDSDFFITCEKNQLKQVFLNILKNAMEAMKDGGEISVTLKKTTDEECIVSVQDQGCGIPEELLPRLGEPFYSLKEKGTGLGVMICHKILKQHHGSISYKSKLNEGTLVEIKLPLVK